MFEPLNQMIRYRMELPGQKHLTTIWEFNALVRPGRSEWIRYMATADLGGMPGPQIIRWTWRTRLRRRWYQVQAAMMNLRARLAREPWPES